jgi:hypothetical protein
MFVLSRLPVSSPWPSVPRPARTPAQTRRVNLEAADCSRHNMMFGDYEVARAEQYVTVR